MNLRDCLNSLNAIFIMRDSALAGTIQSEFAKDLNTLKIFVDDDESAIASCYKDSYDIALVEINEVDDIYVIEEVRYANPALGFIIISDSDLDLLILQCFKFCIFAYLHKSSFFAPTPQSTPTNAPYNMRELEVILAHFALLQKSCEIVHITPRIAVERANDAIYLDNNPIHLSPKLKKIFWLLYVNANRVVPYEHILSSVFGTETSIDSVRMSIVRIKKLLQDDAIIANISGEGYMLVCESKGRVSISNADARIGGGELPRTKWGTLFAPKRGNPSAPKSRENKVA